MAADADPPIPAFDTHALIARLRGGDPAAFAEAMTRTFGNDMGRLVLAKHLMDCGVGSTIGPHLGDAELRYAVGRHDAAIELAAAAGFDQAVIATAVLTGNLEDIDHEEPAPSRDYLPLDDSEF